MTTWLSLRSKSSTAHNAHARPALPALLNIRSLTAASLFDSLSNNTLGPYVRQSNICSTHLPTCCASAALLLPSCCATDSLRTDQTSASTTTQGDVISHPSFGRSGARVVERSAALAQRRQSPAGPVVNSTAEERPRFVGQDDDRPLGSWGELLLLQHLMYLLLLLLVCRLHLLPPRLLLLKLCFVLSVCAVQGWRYKVVWLKAG
jgi:hypothetical protein